MSVRGLVAAMLCSLIVAVAHADEADELEPEFAGELQAPFTLTLNNVSKGEIVVVLKGGDVLVKREDLAAFGMQPLGGVDVTVAGQQWLSLKSVSPPLKYALDERDIALHIVAPPELLPNTKIDLAGGRPDVEYRQDKSAFFNYAPRVTDFGRFDLYEEMGASFEGDLLFSSAYLSSEHRPVRGLSNFVIDDRSTLTRVTLGDSFAQTGALGSGQFLGGATIARAYELDPYTVKGPDFGYVGSTLTPATIDVYVNGTKVRSEEVQPGTFELNRLRLGDGSGEVTYVIRDIFGQETRVQTPFYASSSVLAEGRDQYSYSLGAQRSFVGTKSWEYGKPAFMGRHRLGLSNRITVGGRAEATDELISAGPSMTALTPIGQLELEVGASQTLGIAGVAGALSYTYSSRVFGGGVFGRVLSDRYATLALPPSGDRPTLDAGVFEAIPIGTALSVSVQGSLEHFRDAGSAARLSTQLAIYASAGLNVLISASQSWNEDGSKPWGAFVSLSYAFAQMHNASLTGRVESGKPSVLLNASKSLPLGEGYGYRASTLLGESKNASATLQYQTLFGRYGAQYDVNEIDQHASFDAAGSLVIVPGVGVFPTLPLHDGFGVIRVAGVKNVRGYVNNQEMGRTDSNGNLLVPSLLSYYGNRLSINQDDVPMGYAMQTTDLTLAPPYKGAVVANFPVTIPHFYRGRMIVDDHGKRVVPQYGQVRIARAQGEFISPLGEAGEFELEGVDPGAQTLFIDYADGTCELGLTLADSSSTIIELGEVTCVVH